MKAKSLFTVIALLGSTLGFSEYSYAYEVAYERQTYTAFKWSRGDTVNIPEQTVIDLCGDGDGCTLRMGMYDWDGNFRIASRESLFYYHPYEYTWRASLHDREGTNDNGVAEHVMNEWACYFTDGKYINWTNLYDFDLNFGLLSWDDDNYNAHCRLTIID